MNPNSNKKSITLTLPILEFGPVKQAVGEIRHILDNGGIKNVNSLKDFNTSPRVIEKLYTLDTGEKILVTKKRKLSLPEGVDGVLHRSEQRESKWIAHRKLEQITAEVSKNGLEKISDEIAKSWVGAFSFCAEKKDPSGKVIEMGLRLPQIGGLHAIGAHWSLDQKPATVVMPTGTGKTETMLATLVAYNPGTLLVVVPSKVLRDQTALKFLKLGLLRKLGNLQPTARNPIVGIVKKRPHSEEDLALFKSCNVVVATMSALANKSTSKMMEKIANFIDLLIVDEAHHVAASSWSGFREQFTDRKILQFTATPYRRDGKLVDGKVIYEFPLSSAQDEGYFKPISFEPVFEIDQENADTAIADKAVKILRNDLAHGKDHLMMARCATIERASAIHATYQNIAPDLNPVIIHSKDTETNNGLRQINTTPRQSRIVVCVNMLGEGFDLPQLKIAAVHDTHKSLAILLQFTGRFTRTSDDTIGDATIIANIADQDVSSALERLYSEDADWNRLLSEFSSKAAQKHSELIEFLSSSQRLDASAEQEKIEISHHLLRPIFNTLIYEATSFAPKRFFEGIAKGTNVHRVWIHEQSNTLYFATRSEPPIRWTRSRKIRDRIWDLYIIHYDAKRNLLFLSSSDKSSTHDKIAKAVGGIKLISGDVIFRSLGRINRLIFQNVGVRKHGRRNLRFAMYTGSDVAEALSVSERAGSVKSNLSATGWEDGEPVAIGCSYKGRVWARDPGTIPELVEWCEAVGSKIKDTTIDTAEIIKNVLIPEEVSTLPDQRILSIEWPLEILRQAEDRVIFKSRGKEINLSMVGIEPTDGKPDRNKVRFKLITGPDEILAELTLTVGGKEGFKVTKDTIEQINIHIGTLDLSIEEYFSNYPPLVRFLDISELDGNLLIKPQNPQELIFPRENFEVWDWSGTDIQKESIWKDGAIRKNSIQWRAAQGFIKDNFDVVFDDDLAGEAADLVCLKEEKDCIRLALVHCKFTSAKTAGKRIDDIVVVSSQAVRSAKWKWKFRDLCRHIIEREKRCSNKRSTRFLKGKGSDINKFVKISRFREIKPQILIVQPGLSAEKHTTAQIAVLAAAQSYLKQTVGVDLEIICSK